MTELGLRPSGRLGLSPGRRRLSTPSIAPVQIADLASRHRAVGAALRDRAEVDVTGTVGGALRPSADQPKLID